MPWQRRIDAWICVEWRRRESGFDGEGSITMKRVFISAQKMGWRMTDHSEFTRETLACAKRLYGTDIR